MRSYTFYSKKSGLQIYCTSTVKKGYRHGRIALRAFPMEQGREKRIILMLLPEEAFGLSVKIRGCLSKKEGASNVIVHKREKDGTEIVSSLHIDRWERDGKSGWGLSIFRKEDKDRVSVSVPLAYCGMGYLVKLLEAFAIEQAFEEKTEMEIESGTGELETSGPEPDEEIPF